MRLFLLSNSSAQFGTQLQALKFSAAQSESRNQSALDWGMQTEEWDLGHKPVSLVRDTLLGALVKHTQRHNSLTAALWCAVFSSNHRQWFQGETLCATHACFLSIITTKTIKQTNKQKHPSSYCTPWPSIVVYLHESQNDNMVLLSQTCVMARCVHVCVCIRKCCVTMTEKVSKIIRWLR